MACAISSLPVPVSPLISTVALVGATIRTIASTPRRAALLPTMPGNPLPQSSLMSSVSLADFASWISRDAVRLTAGSSLAQLVCAGIHYSFWFCPLLSTLTPEALLKLPRASFSPDPLADVSWTILELDAGRFTPLKKPDCVTIDQGQVFQIQNNLPGGGFRPQKRFHLGNLLFIQSTGKPEDHLSVR